MSGREPQLFLVARNPDAASRLPYLVRLPVDGGLILKARAAWPTTARVYCHLHEGAWPDDAELVEEVPATLCQRRGPAIDLVLDCGKNSRSQFVFTEVRGRPAIFWQTQKVARTANPGGRVPRRRALAADFTIHVDTRERYPFRFAGRPVTISRIALPAGDYAVRAADRWLAAVERKTPENLASSLSDASLSFQLARLQIRYRTIPIVFADSRKFAEEWTYRFLAAALEDLAG